MMIKNTKFQHKSLRFSRFSRKSYAVFISMGRHVIVGTLRKKIADCSLLKSKDGMLFRYGVVAGVSDIDLSVITDEKCPDETYLSLDLFPSTQKGIDTPADDTTIFEYNRNGEGLNVSSPFLFFNIHNS